MKKSFLLLLLTISTVFVSCSKDNGSGEAEKPQVIKKGSVTYISMVALDDAIAGTAPNYDALNSVINEYVDATSKSPLDQVVAIVNYNTKYRTENKIKGTEYYHYKDGKRKTVKSTEAPEKFGDDSKYMTDLINMAMEIAPAEDYVLIINSHGTGWSPVDAKDPLTRASLQVGSPEDALHGDGISLNRIREGYKNSMLAEDGKKFRAIYFDCCLMHTIENLSELSVVADYSIGSPTYTTGVKNSYTFMISDVREAINAGSYDFKGTFMKTVQRLKEKWGVNENPDRFAIAQLVDLNEAAKLPEVIAPLVMKILTEAKADPVVLQELRKVRSSTFCYNFEDVIAPLYDMKDYLYRIKKVLNDASYDALFADFQAATKKALLYSEGSASKHYFDLGGDLADGNIGYCFSVLIVGDDRGVLSNEFIGAAYETLNIQLEANWMDLLVLLNTRDSRIPKDYSNYGNI